MNLNYLKKKQIKIKIYLEFSRHISIRQVKPRCQVEGVVKDLFTDYINLFFSSFVVFSFSLILLLLRFFCSLYLLVFLPPTA